MMNQVTGIADPTAWYNYAIMGFSIVAMVVGFVATFVTVEHSRNFEK